MTNPWFRLYSRIMTDPKMEFLAFEDQRHFVWLLCMKNEGYLDEKFPSATHRDRMIARKLGLQGEAFDNAKIRLLEVELIDENWQPLKWDDLQFQSDTSKERMRKYRERLKKNDGDDRDSSRVTSQQPSRDVTVTAQEEEADTEQIQSKSTSPNGDVVEKPTAPSTPPCPHQAIRNLYAELLPYLTQHVTWDGQRAKNLQARWREKTKYQNLDWWRNFFERVSESDFLCGRTDGPWKADLEWMVKKSNFAKIIDGKYNT